MLDLPLRIFTVRKRSCGKVIFSEACVKNSVHKGRGWYSSMHCRWYPSMPCRSLGGWYIKMPCRSPGPHPRGKFRGLGLEGSPGPHPGEGVSRSTPGVSRPTPGGYPGPYLGESPGPHRGWGVSQHALRADNFPPTSRRPLLLAVTHPSGMHSCSSCFFRVLSPWIPE